jgi:Glycosyl transferase 4-like domain
LRILVVTWAWPPIGRIGALRPMGMASVWRADGHEVHVLTGPGDRGGEYSPDLVPRAEASGAVVHRAAAPGVAAPAALRPAFEMAVAEVAARTRVSRARQVLSQWKSFPDLQRSWIGPAVRTATALHAARPFDVVWTTSPPESVHFIGRRLARQGLRWVADFRDPWSDYLLARWDPASRWLIRRISSRVLAAAAAVTAATEGVAASLGRAAGRTVTCVRNGFDVSDHAPSPVRRRVLGYFGRIDPRLQDARHLWDPLRALRARGTPWQVEFYMVPGGGGGARIDVPPDLCDSVHVRPPLPHPEALRRMTSMGALLVLGCEGRRGADVVTGKLYEYVGSGRPVLVCAPAGYEARTLVETTGTGGGAWGPAEIAQRLEQMDGFVASAAGRATLSREVTARQMEGIFESIVGPAAPPPAPRG